MATVVLTFTDVNGGDGDVEASIENDTLADNPGDLTPAQGMALAAFRTAMRISEVPPQLVTKDGSEPVRPMNTPDHMGEL